MANEIIKFPVQQHIEHDLAQQPWVPEPEPELNEYALGWHEGVHEGWRAGVKDGVATAVANISSRIFTFGFTLLFAPPVTDMVCHMLFGFPLHPDVLAITIGGGVSAILLAGHVACMKD